ncbi:AAA family ATPase [Providencia rettgeri]|uniref:AAA family ATPase n=2 Tax=Providencia rettgeri TaxID=587 RepID=UPI003018A2A8
MMNNIIELTQSPTNYDETRAALRAIHTNDGVPYGVIARETELSSTAVSHFMNGKYKGDNEDVNNKLTIWLSNRAVRLNDMPQAPDFIETKTYRQIASALQYSQIAQCISVIHGMPGVGKSKSLQYFSRNRPNVWMITVSPSRSSLSECLYELALELGIGDAPRRAGQLGRVIRRKLRGTSGLLIIDEADHLNYPVLEELRILQEDTGIGLALVGNPRVYSKMTGGGSGDVDFARLFSRIAKKVSIVKPKNDDIKAIAAAWNLGQPERELVFKLAEKPGALRVVTHTLRLAAMKAVGAKEALSEKHIRKAIKELSVIEED